MRVVGGEFKGRKFGPKMDKWPTRPTTDYAKESIFNVLNNIYFFEGKRILDLFAGAGGISLEFISRGVEHVTMVENHVPCIKYINRLMESFDCLDKVSILNMDVIKYVEKNNQNFNIVFIDPPYTYHRLEDLPDLIFKAGILDNEGMIIMEHSTMHNFKEHPNCVKTKKYGQTVVSFFEHQNE